MLSGVFPGATFIYHIPTPMGDMTFDLAYWVGTALIGVFVVGGCNAANLIDGLDGLLSGVTAISSIGLLIISLFMLHTLPGDWAASDGDEGVLDGARIVLCLGLLGATLGFLPYNWKPAVIFLGDCGSLLLGYLTVVIILMLGEHGQTHLVFAGLIVFALPIIDTTLAMIRRRLAGVSMSAADNQHLHHQFKRVLGGVRRAVTAMYALSMMFMVIGVSLAGLVIFSELRVRVIYAVAVVLAGMLGVVAVKAARRQQRLAALARAAGEAAATPAAPPGPAPDPGAPACPSSPPAVRTSASPAERANVATAK
jgi:UDP-GlcNAc:undecaprenyl-phosphate GlcNAc-1-phosphate transferase